MKRMAELHVDGDEKQTRVEHKNLQRSIEMALVNKLLERMRLNANETDAERSKYTFLGSLRFAGLPLINILLVKDHPQLSEDVVSDLYFRESDASVSSIDFYNGNSEDSPRIASFSAVSPSPDISKAMPPYRWPPLELVSSWTGTMQLVLNALNDEQLNPYYSQEDALVD